MSKKLSLKIPGVSWNQNKLFPETTMDKIFEKISAFHVKYGSIGNFEFLFFGNLMLILRKCLFWREHWARSQKSMIF